MTWSAEAKCKKQIYTLASFNIISFSLGHGEGTLDRVRVLNYGHNVLPNS